MTEVFWEIMPCQLIHFTQFTSQYSITSQKTLQPSDTFKIYDTWDFQNRSYKTYSLEGVTHVKAAATITKGLSPSSQWKWQLWSKGVCNKLLKFISFNMMTWRNLLLPPSGLKQCHFYHKKWGGKFLKTQEFSSLWIRRLCGEFSETFTWWTAL